MMKKSKTFLPSIVFMIISGFVLLLASTGFAACPDDIVAYWKMDKSVPGGTYEDSIKDYDGTGIGGLTATTGVRNSMAAGFDGATAQIKVRASRAFSWYENESFSMEFYVNAGNTPPASNQVIIGRDDPAGSPANSLHMWVGVATDGGVGFALYDESGTGEFSDSGIGAGLLTDGQWHHVAFVRDADTGANGTTFIYIDGNLQGTFNTVDYNLGFGSSTFNISIGYLINDGTPGFHFNGALDEVAIYDRALAPSDIQANMNAIAAGNDYCAGSYPEFNFAPFPDDTISLWDLDQNFSDAFGENDGTGNAAPTPDTTDTPGINGSQAFDGATTGIDVAASRTFGWFENESFSIEIFVKTSTLPVGAPDVFIGRDDPSGPPTNSLHWWVGVTTDGGVGFALYDRSGAGEFFDGGIGAGLMTDGQWHHVVLVRNHREGTNGATMVYIDGNQEGLFNTITYLPNAGFGSSTAPINIGYLINDGTAGFHFGGSLDEVALYDRALSESEIDAHYTAGQAGNGVKSLRPVPVADAGTDQEDIKETTLVTLNGAGSTPGYTGSTIGTYLWEQTAGTTVTLTDADSATATFTAPDVSAAAATQVSAMAADETLTFRLTVTANDGQSSTDDVSIGVVDLVAPVADAGADQEVDEGDEVTLDGSGSSDADGTIVTYLWEQTVGTTVTLSDADTATATFTAPDVDEDETLTFQLTVTDDDDLSHTDTVEVTVSNGSAPAPSGGGSSGGCFISTMQ